MDAAGVIDIPGAIETRRIVGEQLRRPKHVDIRILLGRGHEPGEPVGGGKGVRVERGDPGGPRLRRRPVVTAGETEVAPRTDDTESLGKRAERVDRAVARGVVEDDRLEVVPALARERGDAAAQMGAALVGDNDDTDRGNPLAHSRHHADAPRRPCRGSWHCSGGKATYPGGHQGVTYPPCPPILRRSHGSGT